MLRKSFFLFGTVVLVQVVVVVQNYLTEGEIDVSITVNIWCKCHVFKFRFVF